MADDLNRRWLAYVKSLRETRAAAHPTDTLDSTTEVKNDVQTERNLTPTRSDLNTVYYLNIP